MANALNWSKTQFVCVYVCVCVCVCLGGGRWIKIDKIQTVWEKELCRRTCCRYLNMNSWKTTESNKQCGETREQYAYWQLNIYLCALHVHYIKMFLRYKRQNRLKTHNNTHSAKNETLTKLTISNHFIRQSILRGNIMSDYFRNDLSSPNMVLEVTEKEFNEELNLCPVWDQ